MNNINNTEVNNLFSKFQNQASIGCGLSDTIYQQNLNRIMDSYIASNDVDQNFMDEAVLNGYGVEIERFEGCCTHGITYDCCPAGCEDPQLKQDYLELIESRLIISDEKAHEIHINIMGEFAKIRIGVFDDMVEVLLANNKTYLSHKLYKYMPNFAELCDGINGTLACYMDIDELFHSKMGFEHQKDGYFDFILKNVCWEDLLGYFRHEYSIDWFKEAKSEMEIAFWESIQLTVIKIYNNELSDY